VLKLAAFLLAAASASAASTPALVSHSPWWEKVTVTISGDGSTQSCMYESSLSAAKATGCEVVGNAASMGKSPSGTNDQLTRITFERRFIPGGTEPSEPDLQPGDTLLGGQVMALAIDEGGAVKGCRVVAKAGEMTPEYGCEEAQAERFEAAASRNPQPAQEGFMSILVYGHAENVA